MNLRDWSFAGPAFRVAMSFKNTRGFTLVEIMTVVLLLSILMGLSIPGYRQYVRRANRTDATTDLLRLAAAQERFYLQNGTYATNAELAPAPPAFRLAFIRACTCCQRSDGTIASCSPSWTSSLYLTFPM